MMVEVIDRKTAHKMMMMVLCGICYQDTCYLVYCIRRDKENANVFVSRLIKGSMGYIINDDFDNGEKEVLDNVVKRLLNKEKMKLLEYNGYTILKDINMDSNISFDMDKCYVCTVTRGLIKDCLIYYDLVNESLFNQPVVEVIEDKRKFNESFASSIVLIVFGVFILIFAGIVVYGIMFG